MRNVNVTAWLGALATFGIAADVSVCQPAPKATVDYPHAGISVAVPEGFRQELLTETYDVFRAVMMEKGKPVQAASLTAYPVGEKGTADAFADAKMAELKKNINIRRLQVLKRSPMPVAGIDGTARRLSYEFRGVKTAAAQVYFIRELKNPKLRLCYLLTVESSADRQGSMLRVLGDIIKSVKLIPIRRPISLEVREMLGPIPDEKRCYAIHVPRGWHLAETNYGAQLAQTDYVLGGIPMPRATVAVTEVAAETTAKECARRTIELFTKAAAAAKLPAKVLSEGPATLGGRSAYQFVFQQGPGKVSLPEPKAVPVEVRVCRIACAPSGEAGLARSYAVILNCTDCTAEAAVNVADRIAGGLRFLGAASQPTTAPATRPK